jgi:methylenetetrahydrofolate reductase (NADPH)
MKISSIFESKTHTFSFEFFPPRDEIAAVDFGVNVGQLMKLAPDFVSVTYGAGGSNRERNFTLVDYLQNKTGLTVMSHYTCTGAPKDKVIDDIAHLKSLNIENLMLLRGDPPKGMSGFTPHPDGFGHASELIEAVRAKFGNTFAVGAGCYPEKHPEAPDRTTDILRLKDKIDAGTDFLITQLFFDNDIYFSFVRQLRDAGIRCRVIPGIIPVTSRSQIERFSKLSGTRIPETLTDRIASAGNDAKRVARTGTEFAIEQCRSLMNGGAPGIHFYTLNKSGATVEIFETLSKLP